jgi:hypothetical protein
MDETPPTDGESLIDYLEMAVAYLRAEAEFTIKATIDQGPKSGRKKTSTRYSRVRAAMMAVEDHLERHFSGPLTPPDRMMGRLIAKHTPNAW